MSKVRPPWTTKQIDALNRWQQLGYVHEFTCPNDHPGDKSLVATRAGWICPHCANIYGGNTVQAWAHDFMADETLHPKLPFEKTTVTAAVLKALKFQHNLIDALVAARIQSELGFFPSQQPWWAEYAETADLIRMLEGPK